ncbi:MULTISPECIES: Txe/YoeB family addiction module toxin [Levilactobacillus]|uniref:Endoribonuclease YoeB n=1 Tax=Levilactobacillus spicheri TaxID=216463 RepID=A0A0F3RWY1_9LACO|nr:MULTISPECIES: Txe/YoeB family addiction module toxin [Levilactobacillus]KJW13282.1 toxin YoeB [Levilactobacillus spicheri]MDT6980600.1 Txe/YoeB family addiction module toxin [Levilactobacillus zymae]
MGIYWSDDAWQDYRYWQDQGDKKKIRKINALIKDIARHPFSGQGKPEPLKHELTGKWSRRITGEHRLIYRIEDDTLYLYSARDHY